MNPVILIFIDGVGIGKEDYENNPFFKLGSRFFKEIFGRVPVLNDPIIKSEYGYVFPSDPLMGVSGLPQSGTGQTSIFCGFNAPAFVGKHFGPYPYSTLIPEIKDKNIFIEFNRRGLKSAFINAYPKTFFEYINSGRQRLSVTTLSCKLNGIPLNSEIEVRAKRALTAEITNERWNKKLGYDLEIISPQEAAQILINISNENDLTVYEYFLTDHFGHGRYKEEMEGAYHNLDMFLHSFFTRVDTSNTTILICSDHGNFEDISIKTHTLNPALTISYGKHADTLFKNIKSLSDIKKTLLDIQF